MSTIEALIHHLFPVWLWLSGFSIGFGLGVRQRWLRNRRRPR